MAYKFVDESEYKKYSQVCSKILKETCKLLKGKGITARFYMLGSGARGLVTRNGNGPYDLDYNLEIIKVPEELGSEALHMSAENLRKLKDMVRNALNKNKKIGDFSDAHDSTSCLTVIRHCEDKSQVEFSFDVAIVTCDFRGECSRLIHVKTPYRMIRDQYVWNKIPYSRNVREKADTLLSKGLWEDVRNEYLRLKDMYLFFNDNNHPSFTVYVEAVNNVYNRFVWTSV